MMNICKDIVARLTVKDCQRNDSFDSTNHFLVTCCLNATHKGAGALLRGSPFNREWPHLPKRGRHPIVEKSGECDPVRRQECRKPLAGKKCVFLLPHGGE